MSCATINPPASETPSQPSKGRKGRELVAIGPRDVELEAAHDGELGPALASCAVGRRELVARLELVAPFIPLKSYPAVAKLARLRLSSGDSPVIVYGHGVNVEISTTGGLCAGVVDITIAPRELARLLKDCAGSIVRISLHNDPASPDDAPASRVAVLRCDSFRYVLGRFDRPEDLPTGPEDFPENGAYFTVAAGELATALRRVETCLDTEGGRYALHCVYVDFDAVLVAGTDTRRLAIHPVGDNPHHVMHPRTLGGLLPPALVRSLVKLAEHDPGLRLTVAGTYREKHTPEGCSLNVSASSDRCARVVIISDRFRASAFAEDEARFPPHYADCMPSGFSVPVRLTVDDPRPLVEWLKRTARLPQAGGDNQRVCAIRAPQFADGPDATGMRPGTVEFSRNCEGGKQSVRVPCHLDGELPASISQAGIKPDQLLDALESHKGIGSVNLRFSNLRPEDTAFRIDFDGAPTSIAIMPSCPN